MPRRFNSPRVTIGNKTPRGPSYFPASRTVSRCEPSSRVFAPRFFDASRPMRLPTESTRTFSPASFIHPATSWFARRIAGDRNVRVSWPGSSVTRPSSSSIRASRLEKSAINVSAPAVGAVGPGGDEQRDVVAGGGVGDGEADGHTVEERTVLQMRDEIVLHEKQQLVAAHGHLRAGEQGAVGAAVGIGRDGLEQRVLAVIFPKLDPHPGGGPAGGEVEDVGAEFAGHGKNFGQDLLDERD